MPLAAKASRALAEAADRPLVGGGRNPDRGDAVFGKGLDPLDARLEDAASTGIGGHLLAHRLDDGDGLSISEPCATSSG
jgi:hypothetical protein